MFYNPARVLNSSRVLRKKNTIISQQADTINFKATINDKTIQFKDTKIDRAINRKTSLEQFS
ncbi:hypothetical protein [Flavobacterium sp. UMI-01]|uniref:hypothetical protein n=1 Tax=Flavobacterium sp. UMI-01 TaxID=1441053 RepID=UPI001C7CE176|nr:hypothetical protein [Flavobacterium sp. UMI-01]GIZ09485.1 hypothetical protein FUMI01_22120 [Flavobacterium sp. UMI-01]